MGDNKEEMARNTLLAGQISSDEWDKNLAYILTMPNFDDELYEHPCYKGIAGKSFKNYSEMIANLYLELEGKPLQELDTSSDSFARTLQNFSRKLEEYFKNNTDKATALFKAWFAADVQPPSVIADFTRCLLKVSKLNVFFDLFEILVKKLDEVFVRDRVACMKVIALFNSEMRGRRKALDMHTLSTYNTTTLQVDYSSKSYQELKEEHDSREKIVASMPVWKAKEVILNLTDRLEKVIEGHFKHFLVLLTRIDSASKNGRYSEKVLTLGQYIYKLNLQGTIFLILRNISSHDDRRPLINHADGKLAVGFIHRKDGKEIDKFVLPVPVIDMLVQVISWFIHQANLYVTAFLLDKSLGIINMTWEEYRATMVDATMKRLNLVKVK